MSAKRNMYARHDVADLLYLATKKFTDRPINTQWARRFATTAKKDFRFTIQTIVETDFVSLIRPIANKRSRAITEEVLREMMALPDETWLNTFKILRIIKVSDRVTRFVVDKEGPQSVLWQFLQRAIVEVFRTADFRWKQGEHGANSTQLPWLPVEPDTAKFYVSVFQRAQELNLEREAKTAIHTRPSSLRGRAENRYVRWLTARTAQDGLEDIFYEFASAGDWDAIAVYVARNSNIMRQVRFEYEQSVKALDCLSAPVAGAQQQLLRIDEALQLPTDDVGVRAFLDYNVRRQFQVLQAKMQIARNHMDAMAAVLRQRQETLDTKRTLYKGAWSRISGALQDKMRILIELNLPSLPALLILRESDPHFWDMFREIEITELFNRTKQRMRTIYFVRDDAESSSEEEAVQARKRRRRQPQESE